MAWSGDRGKQLPPDWKKRREACRDNAEGRCQALRQDGMRCPTAGNEAHHPNPADHDTLIWLCSFHHMQETQKQAHLARMTHPPQRDTRPPVKHPGLQ